MEYRETDKGKASGVEEPDMARSYTAREYLTWTFDGLYELIRGKVHKMSPAPTADHQRVSRNLARRFFNFFLPRANCEAFSAPFDVFLVKPAEDWRYTGTVVEPDLCVICDKRKIHQQGCIGSPEFVVEILSPSTFRKDQREKFEIYEEYGVAEYWIVDLSNRAITRNILKNGHYDVQKPSVEGETIAPKQFAELKIAVSRVFEGTGSER